MSPTNAEPPGTGNRGAEANSAGELNPASLTSVDDTAASLAAIHAAVTILGAEVMEADHISAYAVELAASGWEVFPLRGKEPVIPNPHPKGSIERLTCKGECGSEGHGVLDAATDLATIARWWTRYPSANIGLRPGENVMVIDIDPRAGRDVTLAQLEKRHGRLPATLTALSGRGDGGRHLYWRKPFGKVKGLPRGSASTSRQVPVTLSRLPASTRTPGSPTGGSTRRSRNHLGGSSTS